MEPRYYLDVSDRGVRLQVRVHHGWYEFHGADILDICSKVMDKARKWSIYATEWEVEDGRQSYRVRRADETAIRLRDVVQELKEQFCSLQAS